MKKILNIISKGLVVALLVIFLGGITAIIRMPSSYALVLVSSSIINQISTDIPEDAFILEKNDINQSDEVKQDSNKLNDNINNDNINNDINNNFEDNNENNIQETNKEPVIQSESIITSVPEIPVVESIIEEPVISTSLYSPNLEVISEYSAINTYNGPITAYGPDCYGCSGITASGRNVLNGNIYYDDETFGTIRIVAGDRTIPFGSIVKITGLNISTDPIIAIVLDRGGAIGFDASKHAYFDLLYEKESDTIVFGKQKAVIELLRSGY